MPECNEKQIYLFVIQGRTQIFLFLHFRLVCSITNTVAAASLSEESAIFTKKVVR